MSIMRPEGGWNVTRAPVHPGEMLREEFMKPLGISINRLALELHVPVTRTSPDSQRTSWDYRRYGAASGTAFRHKRRFLVESSEGLRTASGPAQIVEDDREASPAAHGRSMICWGQVRNESGG
jgi:hypothetical protein